MKVRHPASERDEHVASYVARRTGLSFTGSQERRLRQALLETLPTIAAVSQRAHVLTEEVFDQLCEALTIQESYFFREPAKLADLRDHVLAGARDRRTPLRVWSAGCATGEEAYTLAALCLEAGLEGHYQVLGTDLSQAAVEAARAGSYSRWSVRGMAEPRLDELFEHVGSRYRVRDHLRHNVAFEQHNLLDPRPDAWGRFDLVVCRNVLIYFTPEAARAAITALSRAVAPGGWLVLGASDPLADDHPELEPVVTAQGLVYRRRDPDATEPVRRSSRPVAQTPERPPRRSARKPTEAGRPPRRLVRTAPAGTRPDPDVADLVGAAERALTTARPGEAEDHVRAVLRVAPGDRAAHRLLVQALAEQRRVGEAVTAAEQAVARFPDDAEIRHLHAVVLLERGDAGGAVLAARQAVYLDPGLAPAHLVLARAHDLLGNHGAAQRARRHGRRLLGEVGAR